ncbi:hypothetical protein [Methanosphaerula subterraneus]|uniref:hypothetical protein n=1 Tax=Methanosphaerula subterraneus TaxID=3350244 RepID=UPI003F82C9CD
MGLDPGPVRSVVNPERSCPSQNNAENPGCFRTMKSDGHLHQPACHPSEEETRPIAGIGIAPSPGT